MPLTPEISDWQQVMQIIKRAVDNKEHELLLTMLMTSDERDALVARVNIFNELLKGDISQRQISQMLGVGVATITRGSNELKNHSDKERKILSELIKESR